MKKIILIITLLLLTGCYNYREISDLAIVSSFGIDYESYKYNIVLEILENDKNNKYSSYILKGTGNTIESALENASISFNKDLYFIDLDILLISEGIVNYKLDDILNYISKNNNFSIDFNIAVCDNQEIIIESIKKKDEVFGTYIRSIYNNTNNNVLNIKFSKLLDNYLDHHYDIILPLYKIEDDVLLINEAIVMSNGLIADSLNLEEVYIYNILNNNLKSYFIEIKDSNHLIFQTITYNTKYYFKKDTLYILLSLSGTFNQNEKNVEELNMKINILFNQKVENLVNKLVKLKSDPLGLKKFLKGNDLENINIRINSTIDSKNNNLIKEAFGGKS